MVESAIVSGAGATGKGLHRRFAGKPRIAPGVKPSKSMRKVGRLREKAAAASAAGRTKRAEKLTRRADKRVNKETIKRAKRPGYIGVPYAKDKGGKVVQ